MAVAWISAEKQEEPLYRVVLAPDQKPLGERQTRSALAPLGDVAVVGCTLEYVGREMTFDGWPPVTLEPLNHGAKVLSGFAKGERGLGFFPTTPKQNGRWYVPAHVKAQYLPRMAWPKPFSDTPTDDKPSYRLKYEATLGGRTYAAGSTFTYLFWPSPEMVPLNDLASMVAEYFAVHGKNLDLPDAPWNRYDDTLWLPDLAANFSRLRTAKFGEAQDARPALVDTRRAYTPFAKMLG